MVLSAKKFPHPCSKVNAMVSSCKCISSRVFYEKAPKKVISYKKCMYLCIAR